MSEYFGVDPDLHNTAVARIFEFEKLRFSVSLISVSKDLKNREAMIAMCQEVGRILTPIVQHRIKTYNSFLAVEGQEFYLNKNAPSSDIGLLASVTGAVLSASCDEDVFCPKPVEWKGNVPKAIHHGRIAKELGFEISLAGGQNGYGVPTDEKIRKMLPNKSDWKHGMDALGLALWARKQAGKVTK